MTEAPFIATLDLSASTSKGAEQESLDFFSEAEYNQLLRATVQAIPGSSLAVDSTTSVSTVASILGQQQDSILAATSTTTACGVAWTPASSAQDDPNAILLQRLYEKWVTFQKILTALEEPGAEIQLIRRHGIPWCDYQLELIYSLINPCDAKTKMDRTMVVYDIPLLVDWTKVYKFNDVAASCSKAACDEWNKFLWRYHLELTGVGIPEATLAENCTKHQLFLVLVQRAAISRISGSIVQRFIRPPPNCPQDHMMNLVVNAAHKYHDLLLNLERNIIGSASPQVTNNSAVALADCVFFLETASVFLDLDRCAALGPVPILGAASKAQTSAAKRKAKEFEHDTSHVPEALVAAYKRALIQVGPKKSKSDIATHFQMMADLARADEFEENRAARQLANNVQMADSGDHQGPSSSDGDATTMITRTATTTTSSSSSSSRRG